MPRVLILGGSSEAYQLAEILAADLDVVTALAGVTRVRRAPAGRLRVGGFGGAPGLAAYVAQEGIAAIVDATHPFATQMSRNAAEAAAEARVPCLHLVRPAWTPQPGEGGTPGRGCAPGERWIEVAGMAEAADAIPAGASPTFLTVGRTELGPFARRRDLAFVARVIDPPPELGFTRLTLIFGRGPFAYEAERRLLEAHGIRCLVTKNSGGSRAKLDAAHDLGIPVVMVRRPAPPDGDVATSVEQALAWLEARLGLEALAGRA